MAGSDVHMYSLSTCSHCKAAKRLLNECNVDFDYVDVDLLQGQKRQDTIEKVKEYNPKCSFPTIIIGDVVVVGYKEDKIKEALDQ